MGKWTDGARDVRAAMDSAGAVLSDEQALESLLLYPEWTSGVEYAVGDRRRYDGHLYRCQTAHKSQDDWTPPLTPALWTRITAEGEWPEWQPGSYDKDAQVSHNGKHWRSNVPNNVWEPGAVGVYTWDEVSA